MHVRRAVVALISLIIVVHAAVVLTGTYRHSIWMVVGHNITILMGVVKTL